MSRLIIVSNRLPITVTQEEDTLAFLKSTGGLVTAIEAYLQRARGSLEAVWVGWPGATIDKKLHDRLKETAMRQYGAHPVLISEAEMDPFYYGFCNRTLWPLFHYLTSYAHYDEENWETYRRVNSLFADAVLEILRPGDRIWVHDYQLMLLPRMLRDRAPGHSIGFFLHIPFPSFEVFRLLPSAWRKEILEGMVGADVAGFHTQEYTQYFLRSVFRTLGHDHDLGNILLGKRFCKAETFPLGIDYGKFEEETRSAGAKSETKTLRKSLEGLLTISSVDRLDYTKGIIHRLRAYADFLARNPAWHGRVIFLLIVVPSRVKVEQYQQMKKQIDEEVGKINGEYGKVDWSPISYQYHSVSFPYLVALYGLSEVALITPLRDGMNLVAKEYLACRTAGTGVLILSEMAGAAKELGEAILVNPNHQGEISRAIAEALQMPKGEQIRRNRLMQARLRKYDVFHWTSSFLQAMDDVQALQRDMETVFLGPDLKEKFAREFHASHLRLVLLDYDGTLVPFASHPLQARPDPPLLHLLSKLSADPRTHAYIISGRDRAILDEWFESTGIGLIAEHGAWLKEPGGEWAPLKPMHSAWKTRLLPMLRMYADRLPESFLEEKEYSIAWHYRKADPEQGRQRAKELIDDIVSFTANFDIQVLEGKRVVEIRNAGVNKGAAGVHLEAMLKPDFLLAMGDDLTDEDLFRQLPRETLTVKVGLESSFARYHLGEHLEARSLLEALAE